MLKDIINKRYSCRKYADRPIDEELIYSCIETARLAPSACNSQPWMFYVVLDGSKRKDMIKLAQPFTKNAAFIIVEEKSQTFLKRLLIN